MENNSDAYSIPEEVFGASSGYYKNLARNHEVGTLFPSWNWFAFFFQDFWFVYKRCYLCAFIVLVLKTVLSIILLILGYILNMSNIVYLCNLVTILIGVYGNSLYLMFINDKVQKMSEMGYDYKAVIVPKCSPSFTPPLIYWFATVAFGMLCSFILFIVLLKTVAMGDYTLLKIFASTSPQGAEQMEELAKIIKMNFAPTNAPNISVQ